MISIYELKLKYIFQKAYNVDPGYFRDYLFFNTGRSALYFLLKNILVDPKRTTVYVNAYTTDIVHTTIKRLGVNIIPLDIDPLTLMPVNKEYKFDKHSIFIHTGLFGFPCFNSQIYNEVKNAGGVFIEDACNSFGTMVNGREAGSVGDASIFSFRIGKAFSSSGGALKINNSDYFGLTKLYEDIKQPSRISSIKSLYRCYLDYLLFEPRVLMYISRPMRKLQ
ncbi:MAG: DegT/DnrJ/EryC1/StrS family aminotransferase, partial [Rhodoferax sp.]|nr:DegT/DnrJ/EryC1/StrS family aminotransferase [Rhodoferax sp.]